MKQLYIISVIMFAFAFSAIAGEDIKGGETIFKSRCTACHAIDKPLVGPALKDIDKRRDEKWLIGFIQSSQTMIKNGDTAAVNVFNRMNQAMMPDHSDLKNEDIKNIIAFIKDESSKVSNVSASLPFARPLEEKGTNRPLTSQNYWVFITIIFGTIMIIWVLNTIINAYHIMKETNLSSRNRKLE